MKQQTLNQIFNIALCSIVAMLTISCSKDLAQEETYESVDFTTEEGIQYRWQEQLRWCADAYEIVFPDLKLTGWKRAGVLDSQEAIEKFIDDGLQDNKMFGHTVDIEKGIYEVATRAELASKYGVWSDEAINTLKQQIAKNLYIGAEIIELQWSYKGKLFTEKIAVSNNIDELGNSILFNTVNQFLVVRNVPLADWQIEYIKQKEHEAKTITPEKLKLIDEHLAKTRNNTPRIGIDGEEEEKVLQPQYRTHGDVSIDRIGGYPVFDVELIFVAQFEMNTRTFDAWDAIIVKHNSAYGYQCDTDAVLTYGIPNVSAVANYIWGYTWAYVGYYETQRLVSVSRGDGILYYSHLDNKFESEEQAIFCPMD